MAQDKQILSLELDLSKIGGDVEKINIEYDKMETSDNGDLRYFSDDKLVATIETTPTGLWIETREFDADGKLKTSVEFLEQDGIIIAKGDNEYSFSEDSMSFSRYGEYTTYDEDINTVDIYIVSEKGDYYEDCATFFVELYDGRDGEEGFYLITSEEDPRFEEYCEYLSIEVDHEDLEDNGDNSDKGQESLDTNYETDNDVESNEDTLPDEDDNWDSFDSEDSYGD